MNSESEAQLIFASFAFVAVVAERSKSQEWIGSDWIDLQVWQVMSTVKQLLGGIERWLGQPVLVGNPVEASEGRKAGERLHFIQYLSYQLRCLGKKCHWL